MAAPPAVGWVRLTAADPPLQVTARLAEDPPTLTEGFGGWDVVERPRRPPLTSFKAPPGRQLSLPLMFDAWRAGVSIEGALGRLAQMGRPSSSDGETPQLRITARGGGVPGQGLTWVISAIEWGEKLVNEAGDRVRQQVTLTLLEYVEDVYLQERSAANRRRKKAQARKRKRGAKSKRVAVKRGRAAPRAGARGLSVASAEFGAGEDLLSIAARELGDAERWVEIAELNGLRDPRALAIGQVIRLP
jgi:hypothetical protein